MTAQANYHDLAMTLHDQIGTLATVEGVLQFAVEALHYDHASVMLMHRKQPLTIAATDQLISDADQLQIDLGEGPSLLAISGRDDILVEDTSSDTRWPKWAPTAAASGIHCALAIRLFTSHSTSGVLNLVSSQPSSSTRPSAKQPGCSPCMPRSPSHRPGRRTPCIEPSTPGRTSGRRSGG